MSTTPTLWRGLTALGTLLGSLALAAPGQAVTRCVSPTVVSCLDSIQEAVDASAPGDEVVVFDGRYREEVTVATPNLKIRGNAAGTKKPITAFPQFAGVAADLQQLGLAGNTFLATCPKAVVDVCETDNAPGTCGVDNNAADGFTITAPGVTIQDLTIQHAYLGVRIEGVTDTSVRGVCFRDGGVDAAAGSDRTKVEDVNSNQSIDLEGDDSVVRRSLVTNTDYPVSIEGDNYLIDRNAVAVWYDDAFTVDDGPAELGGRVTGNVAVEGNSTGINAGGRKADIGGNLFAASGSYPYLGVDDSKFHDNIVTDLRDACYLQGDDNELWNNVIRRSGPLVGDDGAGLVVDGDRNTLRDNTFTANPGRGANIRGADNVLRRNRATFNGLAGIALQSGSTGNTLDANILADNLGEGLANQATGTVVTGNVATRNRTGVCNDGTIATFSGNNVADGSGPGTPCVVEP